MKVSLKWLGDHVDLSGKNAAELDDLLTFAGIEVEGIQVMPECLVVARVVSSGKHPDADKLSVCQVDDGSGTSRQIVCGASNYKTGDNVPLALPGCVLPGGLKIKVGKLRGVASHGMLCSGNELGLGDDHSGLHILPADLEPGTPLRDIYPAVLDLEITPNRSDLLSHRGIARELAALTGSALHLPPDPDVPAKTDDGSLVVIEANANSHCPFYSGRRIRGVNVGPSPAWLQDKLTSIGLRPINNVVDITNYVLMETGQPLHAFDAATISGHIVVRLAKDGEQFTALDENEYLLTPDDVLIADEKNAVAIGGVMGGEDSGVTGDTVDVILEAAYFTPSCIRRTSRRLNLSSDSSYRFERGVDPEGVLSASALAIRLIVELAGGVAEEHTLTAGALPHLTGPVEFDEDRARALLGADLDSTVMHSILESLGLEKTAAKGTVSTWTVPSFRLDLQRHIDLVEEIARVHGLDKIPATLSARPAEFSPEDRAHDLTAAFRDTLCGVGFFEIRTLKLISDKLLEDNLVPLLEGAHPVRLDNPLSTDHTVLRPSLIPGLLEVAERNVHQGAAALRFFETGTVFHAAEKGGPEQESQHLGLLLAGDAAPASWHDARPRIVDFSDLRGVIELLLPGVTLVFTPREDAALVLSASISAGGAEIGRAGQIWPARARAMDLTCPVFVAELSLDALYPLVAGSSQFEELDRFPAMTRDIAMEVPADLPNIDLESFFRGRSEPLLVSARLFDVFKDKSGKKLAADKKSLAYSLTYRDKKGTLTAGKVDEAHAKILDEIVRELPVQIR